MKSFLQYLRAFRGPRVVGARYGHVDALMESLAPEVSNSKISKGAVLTAIETLGRGIEDRFVAVWRRFDQVDQRFEAVDRRFDQVDQRFEAVDRRFDQVDRRFDRADSEMRDMHSVLIKIVEAQAVLNQNDMELRRLLIEQRSPREIGQVEGVEEEAEG